MKRTVYRASCAVYSILLLTAHCSLLTAYAETANRIVAFVNDEVITEGDIASYMSAALGQEDSRGLDAADALQMRRAVLQRLIEERLIIQEAKRMGLSVSGREALDHLHQLRRRFDSQEAYEGMLQEGHLNEEQLKAKIRERLLVQKAIEREVRSKILVSPTELAKASAESSQDANPGREALAYHLLIRASPQRSNEEAQALINELYERLLRGAEFEEIAKNFSEDPNAQAGGLLGWVREGQLLPELDEVLFRLQPGEFSGPLQSRLGFHLLKVAQRSDAQSAQGSGSRQELEQQLYQEKFSLALDRWLNGLRQRAYIQIVDE